MAARGSGRPSLRSVEERNRLVVEHQPLVRWTVHRFYPHPPEAREDRVAAGYHGLIRAAELWEPEKGTFSTYAVHWIRQAMQRDPLTGYRERPRATMTHDLETAAKVEQLTEPDPAEAACSVLHLLADLPEDERQAVQLRVCEGRLKQEVAQRLGLTRRQLDATVKSGLARLRELAA